MNAKKNFWTILLAVVVVVILALSMFTFTVQEGSQAVVYTFGAIREGGIIKEPGLKFRWPIGIQRVEMVDVRTRVLAVKGNEPITTKDQNQVYIAISLNWKIKDAELFIRRMTNDSGLSVEANAARFLQDKVRDARTRVANQVSLVDIITPSPKQAKNYDDFENRIMDQVRKEVERSDYGIELPALEITAINFAKNSSKPIFDSMIAERKTRSETNITDGKKEAQDIITNAEFEKQKLLSQADADARRIKGEGDAAAAEYYKEFKKNPKLANFLRRLDTLEQILNKKATIALPSKMPLESLIEEAPSAE